MSHQRTFAKALSGPALLLLGLAAPAAQALVMQADVEYVLGSSTLDTTDPSYTRVTDGPASSGFVDVSPSAWDAAGNNIFAHTYGDDSNNFGSRVSGNGTYNIRGLYTFSDTFTNTSGADRQYRLDFTIAAGELMAMGADPLPAGEFALAGYTIDILVNGTSLWSSAAELTLQGDGTANSTGFSQSGVDIGGALSTLASRSVYAWGSYLGNVDLGTVADGGSIDLEYRMLAYAYGNITSPVQNTSVGQNLEVIGDCLECAGEGGLGGSTSRSGDPLHPTSFGFVVQPVVAVPLPGSSSLLGLGLLGLIAMRRRRIG